MEGPALCSLKHFLAVERAMTLLALDHIRFTLLTCYLQTHSALFTAFDVSETTTESFIASKAPNPLLEESMDLGQQIKVSAGVKQADFFLLFDSTLVDHRVHVICTDDPNFIVFESLQEKK